MGTEPISGVDGVSRRRVLLGVAGSSLMGLSGCIVETHGTDSGLEGSLRIDGSNTLLPNTAAVAELFQWENNQTRVAVQDSGTGAGFEKFCTGETDMQNASREITDSEESLCADNDVEWIELEVVLDGIAIFKHPENDWCDELTVDQLGDLWERNSEIETWSDLDDDWPDEELSLYGRDSASGTFDYFTEQITGTAGNIRQDYSGTPDTNQIVSGVSGSRYAVGFGGAGYYYENEDDLDLIAVDDGDGGVEPTRETIESEEYQPLTRPMYLYAKPDELEDELYREFLRFYLDNTQETAREVGFYAVPDETIDAQHEKLDEYREGER